MLANSSPPPPKKKKKKNILLHAFLKIPFSAKNLPFISGINFQLHIAVLPSHNIFFAAGFFFADFAIALLFFIL